MFRTILEFLAMLVFFAVVRSAISRVFRMMGGSIKANASAPNPFAEAFRQATGQAAGRTVREPDLQSAGELQKDPVCGTFVPVSTSLKRMVAGEPVYFCSQACRDQYLVHAK
jgi:YHS domain-containing protein